MDKLYLDLIISVIFGASGFIMAYYFRHGINFTVLGIFILMALKGIECLGYQPDWNTFHKFVSILQQLGKTLLIIINSIISTAGIVSIAMFLLGGLLGLVLSMRGE
jgi:hypothetical protein